MREVVLPSESLYERTMRALARVRAARAAAVERHADEVDRFADEESRLLASAAALAGEGEPPRLRLVV